MCSCPGSWITFPFLFPPTLSDLPPCVSESRLRGHLGELLCPWLLMSPCVSPRLRSRMIACFWRGLCGTGYSQEGHRVQSFFRVTNNDSDQKYVFLGLWGRALCYPSGTETEWPNNFETLISRSVMTQMAFQFHYSQALYRLTPPYVYNFIWKSNCLLVSGNVRFPRWRRKTFWSGNQMWLDLPLWRRIAF